MYLGKARPVYDPATHTAAFVRVPRTGSTSITNTLIGYPQVNLTSGHTPVTALLETFPTWRDQFSFAFVRNPWDRLLSCYSASGRDLLPITKLICDDQGKLLVDFVGRFETLTNDFNIICLHLGIGPLSLPRLNTTQHEHYRDYYNVDTKRRVAERYAQDIEIFGYAF